MPSREKLQEFTAWCGQHITGDEKGQAQIFLDRIFQAFGQPGCLDVGGATEFRIRKDKEDGGGTAFADYVWKPVVLVEMKKRGADLQKHYRQAFDYWTRLVPNRPRYVVLCNFDEFRVYDFDTDLDTPKDTVALKDLPERWGPLAFLAPGSPKPTFENDREKVTREAADCLADCFRQLVQRGVPQPEAQRFILQMLVALFAEDIDLLPKYLVASILEECHSPTDTYDLIGGLFAAMNQPKAAGGGRYKDVPYFNGGLFRDPARLELHDQELVLLRKAARFNWSKVQPEVFGTLFQHSMDDEERHAYGAHFTTPADIMKIVKPTITDPWSEQIESAKTFKRLRELRDRMHTFRVLDPACGSGNFLYIAYREMKRLEARIYERIDTEFPKHASEGEGQMRFSYLSAQNFYGLDILPFAVEIAKVTMMIARKLAIDELHITEQPLPLDNLDNNFIAADALLTPEGLPAQWPKADVIIGNPPFLGAKRLKPERGLDYVKKLRKAYAEVPGMADYCVYWIKKAHDHIPDCTVNDPVAGRAGLVGTQNIRNNQSRVGGLDYVVKTGTIVDAVENQPWSGEAVVHVSIANWAKTQDAALLPKVRKLWTKIETAAGAKRIRKRGSGSAAKEYELDVRDCDLINSTLSDRADVSGAKQLSANEGVCYTGQYARHDGFIIDGNEARRMLAADKKNREVLWPFLVGREMLSEGLNDRWIIDFQSRTIFEAKGYAAPFRHVEKVTLPYIAALAAEEKSKTNKDSGQDQNWLKTWWQLFRPRPELIEKIEKLGRYIVCSRHTKRPIFLLISPAIRPGDALSCFALADDYSFGILQSSPHWHWFMEKSSKIKSDFRYTPESVFDTFPWPQFGSALEGQQKLAGGRSTAETPGQPSQTSAPRRGVRTASPDPTLCDPSGVVNPDSDSGGVAVAQPPANVSHPAGMLSRDAIAKIDAVAAAARTVRAVRAGALRNLKGGLRALYRTLELPGANPLKDAHAALDAAVLAAYGFSAKKDLLAQLLALNQQVAANIANGSPVTAPGVPKNYPDTKKLVTEDCIRPAKP